MVWPNPRVPYRMSNQVKRLDPDTGETFEFVERNEKADELILKYKQKQYQGWDRILLLPPIEP